MSGNVRTSYFQEEILEAQETEKSNSMAVLKEKGGTCGKVWGKRWFILCVVILKVIIFFLSLKKIKDFFFNKLILSVFICSKSFQNSVTFFFFLKNKYWQDFISEYNNAVFDLIFYSSASQYKQSTDYRPTSRRRLPVDHSFQNSVMPKKSSHFDCYCERVSVPGHKQCSKEGLCTQCHSFKCSAKL